MPLEYRVNGPAVLYVAIEGVISQGQPRPLAVTESGVRIGYRQFRLPLHTDVSGPRVPADLQDAGKLAMISGKMVVIDPEVLDLVRQVGDATTVGLSNTIGLLYGTNEHTITLWVDGTNDRPHKFPTCILWENEDELVGTRRTEDDISFYAWPFIAGDTLTAKDRPLFTYERPPGL